MKPPLPIILWLWLCLTIGRTKEVSFLQKSDTIVNPTSLENTQKRANPEKPIPSKNVSNRNPSYKLSSEKAQEGKPKIFTSGFKDIIDNGQVNGE